MVILEMESNHLLEQIVKIFDSVEDTYDLERWLINNEFLKRKFICMT